MTTVYLDRQHAGKPGHPRDRGAVSPTGALEAILTVGYLVPLEARLLELGHEPMPISDGQYRARHERVNVYARAVAGQPCYLAGHLNAGGGNYGAVFCDGRSALGKRLAIAIADAWRAELAELADVRVVAAGPDGWTRNAYATIAGVYIGRACGVCLEPAFIDHPDHKPLLTAAGLRRVGAATATGVDVWSRLWS